MEGREGGRELRRESGWWDGEEGGWKRTGGRGSKRGESMIRIGFENFRRTHSVILWAEQMHSGPREQN